MMMRNRLRVAVIGCGARGQYHLTEFREHPDVDLVACCDVDAVRLEAAGQNFGVGRLFTDYRDLLDSVPVDLVSICTMPNTHREVTVAALSAGAHVLCEKPMAMDAGEAGEMVEAARASQRTLAIGYNMRWMGSAQFARRFVAEGRLGVPQYAHVYTLDSGIPWWARNYVKAISGGGVLACTAVHILDLILWVMGHPEPVAASATMMRRFPERRGGTAPSPEARAAYDVEDLLCAHIRLAGGIAMTLEASWTHDALVSRYGFELTGSQGLLQFAPLAVLAERDGRPVDVTPAGVADADWPASTRRGIQDVVEAVREGRPPLVTGEQALMVQRLSDALYRSATIGREVEL
ncbi:MAG: Gfo/Idh/MocA family oxidoreductase [Chloroflexi bacterium]|nr:Gfo/Idh/MocA family oxidoreductase [Chloroflexota bacterium]